MASKKGSTQRYSELTEGQSEAVLDEIERPVDTIGSIAIRLIGKYRYRLYRNGRQVGSAATEEFARERAAFYDRNTLCGAQHDPSMESNHPGISNTIGMRWVSARANLVANPGSSTLPL